MDHISKKLKVENDICGNPTEKNLYVNDNNKLINEDQSYKTESNMNRTDTPNPIFEQNYSQPSSSERYSQDHIPLENFMLVNENLILNSIANVHNHDNDMISIGDSPPKNNSIMNQNIVTSNNMLPGVESSKSIFCLGNSVLQDYPISQSQSTINYVNYTNISKKCKLSKADSDYAASLFDKEPNYCFTMAEKFMEMEQNLCQELLKIDYYTGGSKITHVYNPIDYAAEIHQDFLNKFCQRGQKVLLLGMNPGPWGMGQTGVPFGHVDYAREWLQVRGEVRKPLREHPKRPVIGLSSSRKEVSGDRLWSLLKELSGTPEALFRNVFLHNYCPIFFMKETGKNVTPPELKAVMRRVLETICDRGLVEALTMLETQHIVAVGNYATTRAQRTIKEYNMTNITVSTLMHPSPINPAANKGWRDIALKQLAEANVLQYFLHTSCEDGVS